MLVHKSPEELFIRWTKGLASHSITTKIVVTEPKTHWRDGINLVLIGKTRHFEAITNYGVNLDNTRRTRTWRCRFSCMSRFSGAFGVFCCWFRVICSITRTAPTSTITTRAVIRAASPWVTTTTSTTVTRGGWAPPALISECIRRRCSSVWISTTAIWRWYCRPVWVWRRWFSFTWYIC